MEGKKHLKQPLVDKTVFLALYLSGTYCHKTNTRPPSCGTPQQLTIYVVDQIRKIGQTFALSYGVI